MLQPNLLAAENSTKDEYMVNPVVNRIAYCARGSPAKSFKGKKTA